MRGSYFYAEINNYAKRRGFLPIYYFCVKRMSPHLHQIRTQILIHRKPLDFKGFSLFFAINGR